MKSFTLGQGSLSWKAALLSCSRVSCGCAWKIQGRSLSLAPVRTVNRNRSPRLKASGRQNNVGKGSRQIRSVTSGQGLALRREPYGLRRETGTRFALGLAERASAKSDRACRARGTRELFRRRRPSRWRRIVRRETRNLELARTQGTRLSN